MGVWLLLFILDNLLNLPAAIRFPLAVAGGSLLLVGWVRKVAIPLLREVSAERIAVVLEQSHGVKDNVLINACQLESQTLAPGERLFAAKTVDHSARMLSFMPVKSFWNARHLCNGASPRDCLL